MTNDATRTYLLDGLSIKTDYPQHSNRERGANDLALLRWAAQRETQIGVTGADRREVAEAVQRLNEIVFNGPDAPTPDSYPINELTVERSMASLSELAGRWLEGGRNAPTA